MFTDLNDPRSSGFCPVIGEPQGNYPWEEDMVVCIHDPIWMYWSQYEILWRTWYTNGIYHFLGDIVDRETIPYHSMVLEQVRRFWCFEAIKSHRYQLYHDFSSQNWGQNLLHSWELYVLSPWFLLKYPLVIKHSYGTSSSLICKSK